MGLYENSEDIRFNTVTAKQLSEIEVGDWLEGYGDVLSLAEVHYIRKYGSLLINLKEKLLLSESQNYCQICGNILDGYVPPETKEDE